MLNKLTAFLRRYEMVEKGDTVICAVSGGADSMALLWAMHCLKDKLEISVEACGVFSDEISVGKNVPPRVTEKESSPLPPWPPLSGGLSAKLTGG